jgi:hypothetical protein
MKPRLINVRLDETHVRKARRLRERGVVLSELVREAIDARFDAMDAAQRGRDVPAIVASVFERFPDPENLPPRNYDVSDPRAARAAIRRVLSRPPK